MKVFNAEYPLQDGYIHNWLVAGPLAIEITDLEPFKGDDFKLQIARRYYEEDSGIQDPPVDWTKFWVEGQQLTWNYYRCQEDHFVNRTAFYHTCHYLRSWAYAKLRVPAAQEATMILTTNGPADVWVNGQHVHRQEHFHHQLPQSVSFQAQLQEGENEILVRFEAVAMRECPYVMALRVPNVPADETLVFIPTQNEAIARRHRLERAFDLAYLERDVYRYNDEIEVKWPQDMADTCTLAIRLQEAKGPIYAEAWPTVKAGYSQEMLKGYQVPDGPFRIRLMATPREYYEHLLRVNREIPFWVLRNAYSQAPYGTYEERRREALEDAARRELNVFSEIARMALGRWDKVQTGVIMDTIQKINRREDCSDFYLTGLLGMMYRYMNDPNFPEDLKQPLEECVLNFRYWMDEPGEDAMCFWSENHQILFHTCEILAGQLYPDRTFSNTGQTGQWHREKGERMALSWLLKRGRGGFQEWDSNCYFEEDILALSHLASLAENDQIAELAAVVLDKMFFTMAINSYKGAFGSTHGRTYAPLIKGARLEATSGISRLMWGMGVFNERIMGTVSLACAEEYELPPIIPEIAATLPEEFWNRERHAGEFEEWCDRRNGSWEVNKVTYKTPDYMLASAQDYHPGEIGYQQHIWQATLSQDAVVFVTHPPLMSEEGSHRPNYWHGNVSLPRVAQWKDVLIAIYKLPDNDWLGFTHAYFPIATFDEHEIRDNWAFARVGEGYLAITASQGVALATRGDNAYRELRSYGQHNVWLCHMGRAALDGSFEEFKEKILNLDVTFEGLSVRCITLRGDHLAFGWEGPLLLNGKEQPITGFKHYENPYCEVDLPAEHMEIRFRDYLLRLHFTP
ncbi:MAG TPA: hypothetical protein G4O02_04745 [Caldilineae bacterium]|nr:hypothetical protein [Caldilineae bacterium]